MGNAVAIGAQRNYRHAVVTLCALAAGALLLGAASAFWISRSITRPLRRALDLARAVAHGDLTQQVEVTAHDEVGELLVSLNDMSAQLSALVADVSQASQAVHLAAREIAQGTDALSTRTQARAANLQETAASVEQITSAGKKNAAHAADADQIARGAHQLAEDGGRVVAQAVSAMGAINGCSTKISDIIVVINDSVDKVQAGTELVDRSGQTLAKIVSAVGQMTSLIGGIATASQEQASGVSRVNDAILPLDDATQQDAALVEQASAATRNLQEQAEALTQRTAHFGAAAGTAAAAERDASPAYGAPYARAA